MAWFDSALANERAAFWSTIVSHNVLGRLLSCELTRPQYLRLLADFRHYDQHMPAVMRGAANQCGNLDADLRRWLLARAQEHSAWSAMWPHSFRTSGVDCTRCNHISSIAARDLCRSLSANAEPARLVGALTVVSWFEVVVAGALCDVLGQIYGVATEELSALEGRADDLRYDLKARDSILGQLSTEKARGAYREGLRLPLPFLTAILSASGGSSRPTSKLPRSRSCATARQGTTVAHSLQIKADAGPSAARPLSALT